MKVVTSAWKDSLLLPMIALPCLTVVSCTILYYVRRDKGNDGCFYYSPSSNVQISTYLCCFPEYYIGLVCLCGSGAFGIAASGQIAQLLQLMFPHYVGVSSLVPCSTHASTCRVLLIIICIGLIGLSIFNLCHHKHIHDFFAIVFFGVNSLFMVLYSMPFIVHDESSSGHESFSDMPGFMTLIQEDEDDDDEEVEDEYDQEDQQVTNADDYQPLTGSEIARAKDLQTPQSPLSSSSPGVSPVRTSTLSSDLDMSHKTKHGMKSKHGSKSSCSRWLIRCLSCRRCFRKTSKLLKYISLWLRTGNARIVVVFCYIMMLPVAITAYFFVDAGKLECEFVAVFLIAVQMLTCHLDLIHEVDATHDSDMFHAQSGLSGSFIENKTVNNEIDDLVSPLPFSGQRQGIQSSPSSPFLSPAFASPTLTSKMNGNGYAFSPRYQSPKSSSNSGYNNDGGDDDVNAGMNMSSPLSAAYFNLNQSNKDYSPRIRRDTIESEISDITCSSTGRLSPERGLSMGGDVFRGLSSSRRGSSSHSFSKIGKNSEGGEGDGDGRKSFQLKRNGSNKSDKSTGISSGGGSFEDKGRVDEDIGAKRERGEKNRFMKQNSKSPSSLHAIDNDDDAIQEQLKILNEFELENQNGFNGLASPSKSASTETSTKNNAEIPTTITNTTSTTTEIATEDTSAADMENALVKLEATDDTIKVEASAAAEEGVYEYSLSMKDFEGEWKQKSDCDNIEEFLTILKKPWGMRKVIKALRLKQKIDYVPSVRKEDPDSLRFTIYKPGTPVVILETPDLTVKTTHGMLGHDMLMLPTLHFIKKQTDIKKLKKIDLSSDQSYDVSSLIIPEFYGLGRDVGVLLGEGRDPKTKKIVSVIDRRIAFFTKEEVIRIFGWKPEDIKAFKDNGGYVFMMLELHVPSGKEAWNRRYFIASK